MRNFYFCMKKNLIWGRVFIILCLFIINVSCTGNTSSAQSTKKILLLGFDGMDPVLLDRYMKEGYASKL